MLFEKVKYCFAVSRATWFILHLSQAFNKLFAAISNPVSQKNLLGWWRGKIEGVVATESFLKCLTYRGRKLKVHFFFIEKLKVNTSSCCCFLRKRIFWGLLAKVIKWKCFYRNLRRYIIFWKVSLIAFRLILSAYSV